MTKMYVVRLALDSRTGERFVYLPGDGEPDYRMNIRTILREGGVWHHASSVWSEAIAEVLR